MTWASCHKKIQAAFLILLPRLARNRPHEKRALRPRPLIGKNFELILEKGMVMALEPKIVFPVKGVVGIENTFVVTDDSLKNLNRYPEDITIFPLSE